MFATATTTMDNFRLAHSRQKSSYFASLEHHQIFCSFSAKIIQKLAKTTRDDTNIYLRENYRRPIRGH